MPVLATKHWCGFDPPPPPREGLRSPAVVGVGGGGPGERPQGCLSLARAWVPLDRCGQGGGWVSLRLIFEFLGSPFFFILCIDIGSIY